MRKEDISGVVYHSTVMITQHDKGFFWIKSKIKLSLYLR